MRRKGTHFFCFLQISAVKNAEIRKMYPQCVQNTTLYQAEHHHCKNALLRTKQSIIITWLYHFVPSGASSSQDCTTPYQAEHHHRKIAPLRTKHSNFAPSPVVPSVAVAAMFGCSPAPYQAEQPSSQYPISINKGSAPNDADPFPLQRVINLSFSHSFVAALRRCS